MFKDNLDVETLDHDHVDVKSLQDLRQSLLHDKRQSPLRDRIKRFVVVCCGVFLLGTSAMLLYRRCGHPGDLWGLKSTQDLEQIPPPSEVSPKVVWEFQGYSAAPCTQANLVLDVLGQGVNVCQPGGQNTIAYQFSAKGAGAFQVCMYSTMNCAPGSLTGALNGGSVTCVPDAAGIRSVMAVGIGAACP